jgi:hypothetical protein
MGQFAMPKINYLHFRFAAVVLCAGAAIPSAYADDAINPDRPNVTNSSQVVGQGKLQLETGLQWERDRADDAHTRTLTTPTMLRIGVSDVLELRIDTAGRTIVHASDLASGAHSTVAGYADTAFGFKWHLADGEGRKPSLALLGEVTLPTGSSALRGSGARPTLAMPAEWDLGQGWSLGVMPGVGQDKDDTGRRYGYGLLAAALGKDLGHDLKGFAELAAPQIAGAAHGGTQVVADLGLGWMLNRDCQLDAMVVHGLNARTPDLTLAFGLSIRR